ncbi:MAG: glycosyltransferase, partial [Parvibaculaceae bacterium]
FLGAQAHKNPRPLIDLARADESIGLHVFGKGALRPDWSDIATTGRLKHAGRLSDEQLAGYYHGVDCVVHTEMNAGWANMVAEAMACGIPVICTRQGTLALAEHERTALVIEEPTPEAIGDAATRLRRDPALARRLAETAREHVKQFSWPSYAAKLLELIRKPTRRYYTYAPELGLYGKWPVVQRLSGLEPLLEVCAGKSVLDLGCAEGVIARAFLDAGASLVHGFDIDAGRVQSATSLSDDGRALFRTGNLADWSEFSAAQDEVLKPAYDIVLYLGVHQHLKSPARLATLNGTAERAREWFAVRMPEQVMRADTVRGVLEQQGFALHHEQAGSSGTGPLHLFKRKLK